jgi:hypothetical protein
VLKTAVEGATRIVEYGSLTVEIPARWIVEPSADTSMLVAIDPRTPSARLIVRILDESSDVPLSAAAGRLIAEERDRRDGFVVTADGAASVAGRDAYVARYAIPDPRAAGDVVGTLVVLSPGDRLAAVILELPRDRSADPTGVLDRAVATVTSRG